MVKRAGIDPTPESVIGDVRVESGAAGLHAVADMWNQVGRTALEIRESLKPITVAHAVKQAGKAIQAGNFNQRLPATEEARAYNNAVQGAYLAKSQNDVDTRLSQAELEYSEDAEGYTKAADGIRAAVVDGSHPQYTVAMAAYVDDQITKGAIRVNTRRQGTIVKESEAALKSRLEVLDAQHAEMLPDDPAWPDYMLQRFPITDALRNPIFGIPDEVLDAGLLQVTSRAQANAIGQVGLQMYEDADDKATGAADAIKFLDEQFKRTDLTLTPAQRDQHMGEARRRITQAETARHAAEREIHRDIVAMRSSFSADARDGLTDMETSLKVHVLPPQADVDSLVEAIQGSGSPTLLRQGREMLSHYAVEGALRGLDYPSVAATVTKWAEESDAHPDNEEFARLYKYGIEYADAASAAQRRNPLEFQRDFQHEALGPVVGPGANPDTMAQRVEQAKRAAATAGGAKVQYYLPAEREAFAALADNGGQPAMQAAMLIYEGVHSEADQRAIFAEIGPAGPALGYAGMMLAGGNQNAARRILAGQQLLRRVGTAGNDGYRPAALKVTDRDSVWAGLTPPGMSPQQQADRRRAADLLFEGAFSEGSGEDKHAYENAVRTINGERTINGDNFGGMTSARGMNVQAPPWMKTSQFSVIMNGLRTVDYVAASATGGAPFVRAPGGRLGAADLATLNGMKLVSTGAPGRYHLTAKSAPAANGAWDVLPDEAGAPYVLDINKLRTSFGARRPDAVIPEAPRGR